MKIFILTLLRSYSEFFNKVVVLCLIPGAIHIHYIYTAIKCVANNFYKHLTIYLLKKWNLILEELF